MENQPKKRIGRLSPRVYSCSSVKYNKSSPEQVLRLRKLMMELLGDFRAKPVPYDPEATAYTMVKQSPRLEPVILHEWKGYFVEEKEMAKEKDPLRKYNTVGLRIVLRTKIIEEVDRKIKETPMSEDEMALIEEIRAQLNIQPDYTLRPWNEQYTFGYPGEGTNDDWEEKNREFDKLHLSDHQNI